MARLQVRYLALALVLGALLGHVESLSPFGAGASGLDEF